MCGDIGIYMFRNMAERGGFVKTTWQQLLLKMECTLRLRSSSSACCLTVARKAWSLDGRYLRCLCF